MKTTITICAMLATLLASFCTSCASAKDSGNRVSQTRKVEAFHAIDITSVGDIYFTQGNKYSLRIEGEERFVNITSTTVHDGTLTIGYKNPKPNKGNNNGITIYLTAPSLDEIDFKGVGSFRCREALRLDGDLDIRISGVGEAIIDDLHCHDLDLHLSGVGDANITVHCDHIDASMSGVGSITLKGRTRTADLHRSGIGSLNRDGLIIEQ